MDRSESKYYNYSIKMNNALFKLLDTKPFQEISVSEVCKVAGVNRSTFYSHYENTTDLLKETHTNFMNKFFHTFDKNVENFNPENIKFEDFVSDKFIIPYLKFIKKHKKIYKIYINNLYTFNTDEFYETLLEKLWIPACKQKGLTDYTIINYMSKYYLSGMTAIINNWVNRNCVDDIILICEIIIMCVRPEL